MIVQELLEKCDVDEIVNNWVDRVNKNEYQKIKEAGGKEKTIRKLTKFIDSLLEIQPNYEKSKNWIILGDKYKEDGKELITANLYNISEIVEKKMDLRSFKELNEVEDLEEKEELVQNLYKIMPKSYSYVFDAFDECMAYQVDIHNIEKYGLDNVLADFLWELTIFGWNEDDKLKEIESLDEAIKEVEKLPKEEKMKYSTSVEEMFGISKEDISIVDTERRSEQLERYEMLL